MGKAYPTHIFGFTCDSCGVRFNVPTEWDYTLDELCSQKLPECKLCNCVMRRDGELYQPAFTVEFEEQLEAAKAKRIETLWRERRVKMRAKREAEWAKDAAKARERGKTPEPPLERKVAQRPDLKLPIVNRLQFLRDIIRGRWDDRQKARDELRPKDARKPRLAPPFRIVYYVHRPMWLWDGRMAADYWMLQDGYIDPQADDTNTRDTLDFIAAMTKEDSMVNPPKREDWTVTPTGPRLLPKGDFMLELARWYLQPSWLEEHMLRDKLKNRLYEHDIETLIERGGKALASEVWNHICRLFMPVPPHPKPKPTTYVRYKPKRDYRNWWERGKAELERLLAKVAKQGTPSSTPSTA